MYHIQKNKQVQKKLYFTIYKEKRLPFEYNMNCKVTYLRKRNCKNIWTEGRLDMNDAGKDLDVR